MCGILGTNNTAWDLRSACQVLSHRGPDSQKVSIHDDLNLAFARLAIIDLSREADQPMSDESGQIRIVFNGEIYGYKKLKEELVSYGYKFRTQSDTEVLLNAYHKWGDEFVDHIDGMFAVAIHDGRSRKLKLFRDRAGIKPLYYYVSENHFAFASELKGITELAKDVLLNLDFTAVFDYLTYQYIPAPKTLYKNVFKLPPASQLTYDLATRNVISIKSYWTLEVDADPPPIDIQSACQQLRNLIHESVKDQLVADVPIGVFLSGGMDSSVIAYEASKIVPEIKTFTIGFDESRYDESEYAKIVSDHLKTEHHHKKLIHAKTSELIRRLKTWYDEPFADTSALPTFFVSEFAKQNATVVLAGDGGDEIFGGYTRYKLFCMSYRQWPFPLQKVFRNLQRLKKKVNNSSLFHSMINYGGLLTGEALDRYGILMGAATTLEKEKYAREWGIDENYDSYWHFRKFYRADLPAVTRFQYLDFHTYLPGDILTKVDRASMAVSLEARVPFLSRKIIEFSFSLPEKIRLWKGRYKGLLKEAYKESLPPLILNRSKRGFAVPSAFLKSKGVNLYAKILHDVFQI
jgi:asparagine synthase (glutamine-hydrolysing)